MLIMNDIRGIRCGSPKTWSRIVKGSFPS